TVTQRIGNQHHRPLINLPNIVAFIGFGQREALGIACSGLNSLFDGYFPIGPIFLRLCDRQRQRSSYEMERLWSNLPRRQHLKDAFAEVDHSARIAADIQYQACWRQQPEESLELVYCGINIIVNFVFFGFLLRGHKRRYAEITELTGGRVYRTEAFEYIWE